MTPTSTCTFTLTPADFARLHKVVARRFRRKVGLFSVPFILQVFGWICVGFAGAVYARLMREYPEISTPLEIVGSLVVLAALVMIAVPHLLQSALRKHMLAPNGAFLSPLTVQLTDTSVHVRSASGNTEVPWSGVIARDEDDVNYYLFIDGMQAFVLPRVAITPIALQFEQYTQHLKKAD